MEMTPCRIYDQNDENCIILGLRSAEADIFDSMIASI